jgi:phospholipid N-methyltransferase
MGYFQECRDFFRQFRQQFHTTGSILPSSRFLSRALASEVAKPHPPAHILEVGPGTGPVTRQLLRRMSPEDRLDAVEINAEFVRRLQAILEADAAYPGVRDRVRIIHSAVEDLPGKGSYDYIISGLPLNNFRVDVVRRIFRTFKRLLKPGGTLSYFEYQLIRSLKMPFVGRPDRRRLGGIGRVAGCHIRDYQVRRDLIFLNVPPAIARHLRFQPAQAAMTRPDAVAGATAVQPQ